MAELLSDPDFYLELELPDLSRPEVIERRKGSGDELLRLRYEFVGNLDPIAQRLIGADRLSWIQEMRFDPRAAAGLLTFGAEKDPKRLHGEARFTLGEAEDGGTDRRLDGELVVAVLGIGGMAERRIVPGLLHRIDIEAQALDDRLRDDG